MKPGVWFGMWSIGIGLWLALATSVGVHPSQATGRDGIGPPSPADTLTEGAAVQQALRASPEARAADARLRVAGAERALSSRWLPTSPVIDGSTRLGSNVKRDPNDYGTALGVSVGIELPTTLITRRRAGGRAFEVATADREAARQTLIAEVRAAVATLAGRQAAFQLATAIAQASDSLLAATELRFHEGDVSELERNLVSVEAARTAGELDEATGALLAAQVDLNRLLGRPATEPIAVEPLPWSVAGRSADAPRTVTQSATTRPSASTADSALTRRPEARAAELSTEVARFNRRLARQAMVLSDLTLRLGIEQSGLFYGREDLRGSPALVNSFDRLGRTTRDLTLSLSVALPFSGPTRGTAQRAAAELTLREAERDAIRGRITAEVAAAQARLTQAERTVERFTRVAPRLTENLTLLRRAYVGGEIDLSTLLVEQDRLYRAQLGLIDALTGAHQAQITLDWALGLIPDPSVEEPSQP